MVFRCLWTCSAIVAATAFGTDPRPTKEQWDTIQGAAREQADAEEAREKKMAAVNKAINMLESLRTQVLQEGEDEAATYNKFACFCKDTTSDRLQSIESGEDQQTTLQASISTSSSRRDTLDDTIKNTVDAISELEKEMKNAVDQRQTAFKLYEKNANDLTAALEALEGAIQSLKAAKSPSLMQLQTISETVRTAMLVADALGLGGHVAEKKLLAFFQEDPAPANEVQFEDYKFRSDDIISTLEGLERDFKGKKSEVDGAEVDSVRQHDLLMQEKTNAKKTKNRELVKAQGDRSTTIEEIATASQQLSLVKAQGDRSTTIEEIAT